MIRMFSLRIRMMLLFCTVVGIFLGGTLFVMYGLFSREMDSQLNCRLLRVGSTVVSQLVSDPKNRNVGDLDVPKEYFEVLDSAGRVLQQSKNLNGRPMQLSGGFQASTVVFRTFVDGDRGRQRLAMIPFNQRSAPRMLAITMPMGHDDLALGDVKKLILWVLPIGLFLTAVISIWYVGRSLRPVTELTSQAERMMEEIRRSPSRAAELEQTLRIPFAVSGPNDELGRLASTYNLLFTSHNAALRQHRQFVSDAAHELRTPLHVLRGETELLLSQPRTNQDYLNTVKVIDNELLSLTRIVEALFTLSMADAGQLRFNCEPLYLNDVVEQACARITPLAQAKRIRIQRQLTQDIPFFGDEALLQELSVIFLDNAIKYSPPNTQIRVTVEKSKGEVRIKFQDQGYGISKEHLPHIFERFYRVHGSNDGEARSGGLGLAIAQAIVQAQCGSIECSSVPGNHTTFTVTLRESSNSLPLVDQVPLNGWVEPLSV